jgi:hypothetical protein
VTISETDEAIGKLLTAGENSAEQFETLIPGIVAGKREAITGGDEAVAKRFWAYEQVAKLHMHWAKLFCLLKDERFYDAWRSLEKCELIIRFLAPHLAVIGGDRFGVTWIQKAIERFQSLYPYALFFSPAIVELEKICSICRARISARVRCDHEVGEIYGGEMCSRIVTKGEVLEISLVEQPVQKYSVPFLTDEKTGKSRDHYDYAVIKYAVSALPDRFTSWQVKRTTKRYPIARFSECNLQSRCPCGSGKTFQECCSGKAEIEMPHLQFVFALEPENVPREALFLDGRRS